MPEPIVQSAEVAGHCPYPPCHVYASTVEKVLPDEVGWLSWPLWPTQCGRKDVLERGELLEGSLRMCPVLPSLLDTKFHRVSRGLVQLALHSAL